MKPHWKKKWLAALRSGEYKQGKGALRRRSKGMDRHCCLGVLNDLMAPALWSESCNRDGKYDYGKDGSSMLSRESRNKAGLAYGETSQLIDMNDSGKRFTTIAKWIEENL